MTDPFLNPSSRTLVVGLGSSHGDDQAGWKVIDQLERFHLPEIELRRASVPHDIVDWLDGQGTLHIIDACVDAAFVNKSREGPHKRFEMEESRDCSQPFLHFRDSSSARSTGLSIERPAGLRSAGSHQINSLAVLELAYCLKRLPKRVLIWCIPGQNFEPGSPLSADCEAAISSCAVELSQELDLV